MSEPHRKRSLVTLLFALVLATVATGLAQAREIPVEDFFRRPQFSGFQLSPDGRYLAAITPVGEEAHRNIAVIDLETRDAQAITNVDGDVSGFFWANDERILFYMDTDGNESFGIFAVDRDGRRGRTLIEPPATQIEGGSFVVRTATVISPMKGDPKHVLVSTPRQDGDRVLQDVEKMNIYNGRRTRVEYNPGDIAGWIADEAGVVYGAARLKGAQAQILYRADPESPWEMLTEAGPGEPGWSPVFISKDRERMYVSSTIAPDGSPRDKAAIYRYDLAKRELGPLVYEHPSVDVTGVIASEVQDDIVGVAYLAERPERHFTDPTWSRLMAGLEQAFPERIVSLASASEDEQRIVLRVWDANDPGRYFLLDRKDNRLEELAKMYDWLAAEDLAPVRPVSFTARDGLELHGYLTLPVRGPERGLPLVLHPHGGPAARDGYGFDPFVQLLANRGYAVLQVNFRGSTGYGRKLFTAGFRQWGATMQDDLTDAVRWAVDEGIADPKRVCIFGASYGGYAAMAGLTFTPELYQCGINYVGVTDIPLLFETAPQSWALSKASMKLTIGDPDDAEDLARMRDRSPLNHVESIRAPLLMAYGEQDPRVVLEHATALERELKRYEKDYELIVEEDEGHGFSKLENQVEFGKRLIGFLDEHIGDRSGP